MLQRTLMQRHQQRWLECRHCRTQYAEAINTEISCLYHPGKYELACIKSCPSRQGSKLRPECIKHRMKRWTCCDTIKEVYDKKEKKKKKHLYIL